MRRSCKSYILVAVQAVTLIYLMLSGPVIPRRPLPLLLVLAGGSLGIWALLWVRLRNLSPFPEPLSKARIVTTGPYRLIRHPMYAAVLLAALGWSLATPTTLRLLTLALLAVDLALKMRYEEGILNRRIPDYAAYASRTKRILPYVY